MKTLMKKSILVIVFVALISCERVDVPPSPERISHGMIELGEKLEDPYSVDNITKAVESLYPSKAGRVEIAPTDFVVDSAAALP